MPSRLVLISIAFHAFNLASLIVVARLWRHRYAEEPAIRPRPTQLGADLSVLGLVAVLSAVVFGAVAGEASSGALLLGSQWIVAELLLLVAMAATLVYGARTLGPRFARSRDYGFALSPDVRRSIASTSPLASAGMAWPGPRSTVRGSILER